MREKIKSIALGALIVISLWQTYLLAYSKPELERIDLTSYVDTELQSSKLDVMDMFFPKEVVIHFGEDRHTVLYPGQEFYKKIYEEKIKQRTFDGFRLIEWDSKDWNELRASHQGIEIRFHDGIPISILQNMLQLRGDILNSEDRIQYIWIIKDSEQQTVLAYFFSDKENRVYESSQADLQVSDVEQYVRFGEYLNASNNYINVEGNYYLPEQPVPTINVKLSYEIYTPDQWRNSLFVDPSISRNFIEKDGTEIYTDGKRGLQINHIDQWLSYSDPVAPVQDWPDVRTNLYTAVQFVNQHGGWGAQYMLDQYPEPNDQQFRFYPYYEGFPVLSDPLHPFGWIEVTLQKSVVSSYERSLVQMKDEIERTETMLPGGEELQELIDSYPERQQIRSVFPAYRPYIQDELIELVPQWAVIKLDGTYDYLQKR